MSVMLATFQSGIAGQTIDMANATHTLTTAQTSTTAQTQIQSRLLFVDANGGANNLDLPVVADLFGEFTVVNTGGEDITVRSSAAATVVVIATAEIGKFWCDGSTLFGSSGVA